MDSVELVKKICKERKIPISQLETKCEFSNGYIRKLKEGKFPSDRLVKIAKFLNVTTDYLLGNTTFSICPVCGFGDNPLSEQSRKEHEIFHQKFLKIKEKYPFFMPFSEASIEKTDRIFEFRNPQKTLEGKIDAFEKYLEAAFSLEICQNNYNIDHLDYEQFCKVEVGTLEPDWAISNEFVDILAEKYGVDKDYMIENAQILARASKVDTLMRLLAYAEKLSPQMQKILELQAKALSEQNPEE